MSPYEKRRSMQGYDFAQHSAYFVTICTHERQHVFGDIVGAVMVLNRFGEIAQEEWLLTADIHLEITLDAFVIMPNHVHGILVTDQRTPPKPQLAAFVAGFKAAVTKRIEQPIWQRGYDAAIIRSEITLNALRQYIEANPARWAFDKENV